MSQCSGTSECSTNTVASNNIHYETADENSKCFSNCTMFDMMNGNCMQHCNKIVDEHLSIRKNMSDIHIETHKDHDKEHLQLSDDESMNDARFEAMRAMIPDSVRKNGNSDDVVLENVRSFEKNVPEKDRHILTKDELVSVDIRLESQEKEIDCPSSESSVLFPENTEMMVGRRIVDIPYFVTRLADILKKHSSSHASNCHAIKCINEGFLTRIQFACKECDFKEWISSENIENRQCTLNNMVVLATLVSGTGYEGIRQISAGMNIPCMASTTYTKIRNKMVPIIEQAAKDVMTNAGLVEKEIAIEKGHVIKGIPFIDVEGDGGYGKRSYRTGKYDSLTCVGVVVGAETKKVLHAEVRNKYCSTCFTAARKNRDPRKHRCFKNWSYDKSSSSMETDCIVRSFEKSVETHGLIYKTYIGDGDSSTYKAIVDHNVYKAYDTEVGRLYCYNHIYRNMCNKIVDVASRGKVVSSKIAGKVSVFREYVRKSAFRIRKTIEFHVKQASKQDCSEKDRIKELQRNILNVPRHIYGDHKNCTGKGLNCERPKKKKSKSAIPTLIACGLWDTIYAAVSKVSCYAKSLLRKVTTNACENFNSVVAKFIGGKRINFAFTDAYFLRIMLAVIQFNTGCVYTTLAKYFNVDFSVAEALERKLKAKVSINKAGRLLRGKSTFSYQDHERYYGDNHEDVDIPQEQYDELVRQHFQDLEEDRDNREQIEEQTRNQSSCDLWHNKRRKLLTASKFGEIFHMRDSTSCASKVKNILYPQPLDLPQLQYGLEMEAHAIKKLEEALKVKVEPSGLIIDADKPYFAASLDGKIGTDGIVEIKSPSSVNDRTPLQAIKENTAIARIFSGKDFNRMNKAHNYYFQIQGQMHISKRTYCYFVLFTQKGIKYVKEEYDDKFWAKMEPKLTRFYMKCLLPEIVERRVLKGQEPRDPDYIVAAQKEKRDKQPEQTSLKRKVPTSKMKNAKRSNKTTSDLDTIMQLAENDTFQYSSIEDREEAIAAINAVNTSTDVDEIIPNILDRHYMLCDVDIESFMNVVRKHRPMLEIHPVQYFTNRHLLMSSKNTRHIQIIGGHDFPHWICCFYDGTDLFIYDSLNRMELERMHEEEIKYIRKRYPHVSLSHVLIIPVTRQPDATSCGIYAAAFVTEIVLHNDPAIVKYSTNVMEMRNHYVQILRSGQLQYFPRT